MNISQEAKKVIDLLNPWWQGKSFDYGLERPYYKDLVNKHLDEKNVLLISGPRRVGKTTLIFQTIQNLLKSKKVASAKDVIFLSLDNPVFEGINLELLISEGNYKYVFLDEIQYFKNWQKVLKALYDNPSRAYQLVCSGSASGLISDETSFLTGRTTKINILPLSYDEFKVFSKYKGKSVSVDDYLEVGGYPEYVLERFPNYHNSLFNDVVQKDIVEQFNINRREVFYDICTLLAKQVGFGTSFNKMANVTSVTDDTVKSYTEYLSKAFIVFALNRFSPSVNERVYSARKFYFYDTGMRNSFVGFEDLDSLAENAVFNKLNRMFSKDNVFYLTGVKKKEVDFLVKDKDKNYLVEVKYAAYKEKVINSLSSLFFTNPYDLKIDKRVVVTKSVTESVNHKDCNLHLVSLEGFLSEGFNFLSL